MKTSGEQTTLESHTYIDRVKQKVFSHFFNVVTVLPVTEIGGGKQEETYLDLLKFLFCF